jgi:hypothetical protein
MRVLMKSVQHQQTDKTEDNILCQRDVKTVVKVNQKC